MAPKNLPEGWVDLGSDGDWAAYGGKWGLRVRDPLCPPGKDWFVWFVIEVTNMDDEGQDDEGQDDEGQDVWVVELKMVDMNRTPQSKIKQACESSGYVVLERIDEEHREAAQVEALHSYGLGCPLDTFQGGRRTWKVKTFITDAESDESIVEDLREQARAKAMEYAEDSDELESMLDRPVNKIGSTAREYGTGRIDDAMERGAKAAMRGEAVSPDMSIMLKVHYQLNAEELKQIRDWAKERTRDMLPFAMCYLEAMSDGADIEKLKKEYHKKKYSTACMAGVSWAEWEKAGKLKSPPGIKRG